MSIYVIEVRRGSRVKFAVRANDLEEAENKVGDYWTDDDTRNGEVTQLLNEREEDEMHLSDCYMNDDDYNRNCHDLINFDIRDYGVQKEPRYDLYIVLDEEPCHFHRKVWQDLTMESVLNILKEYNQRYVLKKKAAHFKALTDAMERGCDVMYYKAEKRKD